MNRTYRRDATMRVASATLAVLATLSIGVFIDALAHNGGGHVLHASTGTSVVVAAAVSSR
jgi:hypothetical protein